jgi:hypothetical protein
VDERQHVLERLARANFEASVALEKINPADPWISGALEIGETIARAASRCDEEIDRAPFNDPFYLFDELPQDVQDRLILEALGDQTMTTVEVTAAVKQLSPHSHPVNSRTYVLHLFKVGALGREEGHWGACRYRYFKAPLDAALADLEQVFHRMPMGQEKPND